MRVWGWVCAYLFCSDDGDGDDDDDDEMMMA